MKLEGQRRFRRLIESHGGVLSTDEVASLLNITPSAVKELHNKNKLISFLREGTHYFPAWQFKGSAILPQLQEVMDALGKDRTDYAKIRFFLTHDKSLNGMNRIEALSYEKNIISIIEKAKTFDLQDPT